jgi:predicted subunit of tRNA(5-methylaminomethyl-2-thiouridylate) methyltransferase
MASTVAVCFSGGKDSALAALLLEPFYDVTLVTATFSLEAVQADGGVVENGREAAQSLGFPFESVALDDSVAHDAVEQMVADGYPRNGIQAVHEHALETLADTDFDAIADGTRRDDRAPTLDRPAAQSLEDRHDIDYLQPLAGLGRGAVDDLTDRHLVVETGPSDRIEKADYETELRALIRGEYGKNAVGEVFPEHSQSRVRGRQN